MTAITDILPPHRGQRKTSISYFASNLRPFGSVGRLALFLVVISAGIFIYAIIQRTFLMRHLPFLIGWSAPSCSANGGDFPKQAVANPLDDDILVP